MPREHRYRIHETAAAALIGIMAHDDGTSTPLQIAKRAYSVAEAMVVTAEGIDATLFAEEQREPVPAVGGLRAAPGEPVT